MSVTVIAEPGACHDGSLDAMKGLIDAAVACGADVFKPQFWSSADRLADRRQVEDQYRAIYRTYQMPRAWLFEMAASAGRRIGLYSSIYLPEDAATVAPYVSALKIASFEAQDEHLVNAAIATGLPLVISLGMADEGYARWLQRHLERERVDYRLLHCTSSYPAPLDEMHLEALELDGIGGWLFDGLSDHSADVRTGGWAVSKGASMVEFHLKLDTTDPDNVDAPHALSPDRANTYVRDIRDAERALGVREKRRQPSEREMAQYVVRGAA